MTFLAHLSSGYVIYKLSEKKSKNLLSKKLILTLSVLGAFAPDIDGFFGNQMNNHRNTVFHAPLFWFSLFLFTFALGMIFKKQKVKSIALIFLIGVFTHLILDWISSRTCGIRFFYPLSAKMYSLFPLKPEKGNIPVFPNREQLRFWQFYLQNKILIAIEGLVILFGLSIFVLDQVKNKINKTRNE